MSAQELAASWANHLGGSLPWPPREYRRQHGKSALALWAVDTGVITWKEWDTDFAFRVQLCAWLHDHECAA